MAKIACIFQIDNWIVNLWFYYTVAFPVAATLALLEKVKDEQIYLEFSLLVGMSVLSITTQPVLNLKDLMHSEWMHHLPWCERNMSILF